MSPDKVYFIKPIGMYGPIKIGCSNMPTERLATLMVWSPFALEILATTAGSYKLEQRLHRRFAKSHRHGEWFEPTTDLMVGISALQRGVPVEEAFDLSLEQGSIRKGRSKNITAGQRLHMSVVHRLRWALRRAEAVRGCKLSLPPDVWDIYYRDGDEITPADLERVAGFIADAVAQCPIQPVWKVAA